MWASRRVRPLSKVSASLVSLLPLRLACVDAHMLAWILVFSRQTLKGRALRANRACWPLQRGAGTPVDRAAASWPHPRAVTPDHVEEAADTDGLLDVAGKPGGKKPVTAALERMRAQRDNRDRRRLGSLASLRVASVRSCRGAGDPSG